MSTHSDEHLVAIVSFEGAVKRAVARIRAQLAGAANSNILPGNEFHFIVKANGRILDGEVKLSFSLNPNGWDDPRTVTGNSMQGVVDEYLRRAGWNAVNAPLQLGAPTPKPEQVSDDEIPF